MKQAYAAFYTPVREEIRYILGDDYYRIGAGVPLLRHTPRNPRRRNHRTLLCHANKRDRFIQSHRSRDNREFFLIFLRRISSSRSTAVLKLSACFLARSVGKRANLCLHEDRRGCGSLANNHPDSYEFHNSYR